MLNRLWKRLGIAPVRLELNCLGQLEDRKAYREVLIQYFEAHKDILDEDASRRLYSNPLRILDTKNPDMQDLVNNAPKLYDSLGEESKPVPCRPGSNFESRRYRLCCQSETGPRFGLLQPHGL